MTPIEVMEAIIAENLAENPRFYDPPEWADERLAATLKLADQAVARGNQWLAERRAGVSRGSNTVFR